MVNVIETQVNVFDYLLSVAWVNEKQQKYAQQRTYFWV